ncbi:hypothetical protein [Brachyspira aalborgi]|jgi:hypothetical protein|uniref:Uncharacterized protein n=1 Tax=Brachyspira aalborgi TaxID=29522 RepID=A0A5C8ETE8_9SPIR|nr:hypothetical protein [Brachyspira aalborgi]MBS4762595.1 hypothetical protein [Brachyspira sp.]CCY77177.1 putative uncharacterized protein [Brachyspira sp. CAG:700]TXJ34512.1 hypothetical protein EPJ71_01240 [Brachyspira aalborgi]TXJ41115.1 hypothetical protein EPJ81_01230 [Brachyspira aalborgi]TXJ45982.1 hypothetical protein EPJ65_00435 [Brachyspira aalborgi]
MPIEIRAKLKPFIIILIIITILVAGFFITRSFLNNKRFEAVSGIDSESFNNEIESDTTIDDIFGDNITKEEKDFLSTNNNIAPIDTNAAIDTNSLPYPIQLDNNGLYEVNTNNIPDIAPTKPKVNTFPKKDSPYVYDNTSSTVDNQTAYNQNVRISSFIINYNDRFIASRSNPLLITLAVKTPPQGKFARIRVYARRIDDNYNILSRNLIFYLPKIYVIDGQAQTQFYFAGRSSSIAGASYLPKGRYILYAEAEITDINGRSVGKTGRYPLPKWNYIITLR